MTHKVSGPLAEVISKAADDFRIHAKGHVLKINIGFHAYKMI